MKKAKHILEPLIFLIAMIIVIGSPGAVDFGHISLSRAIIQMAIGVAVICILIFKEAFR